MAKWVLAVGTAPVVILLFVMLSYCTVPNHNCGAKHFETLIVLGCPPDPDGGPSSEERERVQEAVRQYQAGRANHIILTGGAPHSEVAEAVVMMPLVLDAGIPERDLVVEPRARNTIENIFYSNQIMRQRGWKSAEVISSPSHLARVSLILEHYSFCWRTQAGRWPPEYSLLRIGRRYFREALGTTVLRWIGFRPSAYLATVRVFRSQSPGWLNEVPAFGVRA